MKNLRRLKDTAASPAFYLQMQGIFFEAMNAGYAAEDKSKKGSIAELPGSKTITYAKDPWVVLDVYQVTPISSFSGGTTHILYECVPVWMMQYFGMYHEDAIPFLKAALRHNYESSEFLGGRGPGIFIRDGWGYSNHSFIGSSFAKFSGYEYIWSPDNEPKGWHNYHGGLMI
ncbi:MAG: DUF5680 domain-containing protein [bacterium]|nr:DUF5680 domain-containing protein [bacterium]